MFSFVLMAVLAYALVRLARSKIARKLKLSIIPVLCVAGVVYLVVVFDGISFAKSEPIAGKYHSDYNGCIEAGQSASPVMELLEDGKFRSNIFVRMWDDSAIVDSGEYKYDDARRGEEISLISSGREYTLSRERGLFRYYFRMYCGDPDGSEYMDLIRVAP